MKILYHHKKPIPVSEGYGLATMRNKYVYYSTDYFETWIARTDLGIKNWAVVEISSSKIYQVLAVAGEYFYISNNSGLSFRQVNEYGTGSWQDIGISNDGKYMLITRQYNYPLLSSDYGATFSTINILGMQNWAGLCISGTGKYMYTCVGNGTNGYLYFSSDYGITWAMQMLNGDWDNIVCSSSGQYILGNMLATQKAYLSNNYGVSFSEITQIGTKAYNDSAISSDGKYMLLLVTNGYIYLSSDYGVNWSNLSAELGTKQWRECGISGSGKYMVAATDDASGKIYYTQNYGVTWSLATSDYGVWSQISLKD